MITAGDTTSSLKIVQVFKGIESLPSSDPIESEWILDVAQWEPTGAYFCEFEMDGQCDSGTVAWGTSDPFEPKFCTKHLFDGNTGYDFVAVE